MKKISALFLILVIAFSIAGCGKNQDTNTVNVREDNGKNESNEEKASAVNDVNNNGKLSIMESDLGYYMNLGYNIKETEIIGDVTKDQIFFSMCLKFHDKETGTDIPLCSKPECEHKGDDKCVATYKNIIVINTLKYEDALYVYGIDKTDGTYCFNLYKVAPDGSSIDLVGTVFEGLKEAGGNVWIMPGFGRTEQYYFIIHRGYAYLPYYFRVGEGLAGYQGGGLKKMDIKTGKTEDVYVVKNGNDGFPFALYAVDDYLYTCLIGYNNIYGWKVYDIKSGEFGVNPWKTNSEGSDEKPKFIFAPAAENDKYGFKLEVTKKTDSKDANSHNMPSDDDVEYAIIPYEKYNAAPAESKKFKVDIKYSEIGYGNSLSNKGIMVDGDRLFVTGASRIQIYGIGENDWGKKLGDFSFESVYEEGFNPAFYDYSTTRQSYKLCNGTLYKIVSKFEYEDIYEYYVYSCAVDSIIKGEGSWTLAFDNIWKEE